MMPLAILGWGLTVPGAMVALALPLGILLLSFMRRRPQAVALGTARFFGEGVEAEASRRRWHLSGARFWALVALLLGILAASRPRPSAEENAVVLLTVYVDRSPSMFLPMDPVDPDGERRVDRALAATAIWLETLDEGGQRAVIRWRALEPGGLDLTLDSGEGVPGALVRPPARAIPAPRWGQWAAPGAVFVTDSAQFASALEGSAVGVFASGGATVPGPVSAGSSGLLTWGGADGPLEPLDAAEPLLQVHVGDGVPGPLRSLVRLWADERGIQPSGGAESAGLTVRGPAGAREPGAGPGDEISAGRDGWSASFDGATPLPLGTQEGWRPWLVGDGGECLVRARSGEVEVGFAAVRPSPSMMEAFVVSWARLLDEHLAPPAAVVSMEERSAAGAPMSREPALEGALDPEVLSRRAARAARGRRAELLLAAGAAAAGLLAFALRLRGSG